MFILRLFSSQAILKRLRAHLNPIMGVVSREDHDIVLGRGVGNTLTDFLDTAEERLWIMTDRIDEKYARQLLQKHRQGANVKLILNGELDSQEDAVRHLLEPGKSESRGVLYRYRHLFLFAALFSAIGAAVGFSFESQLVAVPVALAVIFGGLTLLAYSFRGKEATSHESSIDLYTHEGDPITNSRIYVLDGRVLTGSADLTDDSLWRNMEILFELRDEEVRSRTESMFNRILDELEKTGAREWKMDQSGFED